MPGANFGWKPHAVVILLVAVCAAACTTVERRSFTVGKHAQVESA